MNSVKKIPQIDHQWLSRHLSRRARFALPIVAVCIFSPAGAMTADNHLFELKARVVHFDRDFENPVNDRVQTGLGLQLNYESPYFSDIIGVGISGYSVSELGSSGRVTNDILKSNGAGGFEEFSKVAQSFVKLKYKDLAQAKFGRQLHNSMLLRASTSRAIPETYSGANGQITPIKDLKIYGAVYDRWSSRTSGSFEGFRTDLSASGSIDAVSILGSQYKHEGLELNVEYLRSKSFLSKYGLVGSYSMPLANKSEIKITSGFHASNISGSLAVTGAEGAELDDEDIPGSRSGSSKSGDNGSGIYIQANWKLGNLSTGGALSKFNGTWIEDNFAGDSGTNVFPTGGVLADFSNRDELVWMLRASYNLKDYIKGLTTTMSFKRGTGAKNSAVPTLGAATERELDLGIRYNVPFFPGLSASYRFLNYKSNKSGRLDGVKEDNKDHRIYLDYAYRF